MLDVVTVGNAVLDVFLELHDDNKLISLDETSHKLCLPYGEKILVDKCTFMLGGNATNVAVGLRRLGLRSALMAEIGMDEFSAKILNILRREEVVTDFIQRGEKESSMTIGINFQGERTLFVEHKEREHAFRFANIKTSWIYLTSLGRRWHHVYRNVSDYLTSYSETKLAFNPGSIQYQEGVESFAYLLPQTTVLFVNKEEALRIVQKEQSIEELLHSLSAMGVKIVVITDGKNGSYVLSDGRIYYQESINCRVVERTGAGDAYASGMLAGIIYGKSISESMKWGAKNAASVIEQIGAQQGLLSLQEIVN
ncbi:MAG: sugar kinase [Patescibacteria group bacterium]|nr:MAG: sugar kinase [Patescibacteria group bacterium]